MSDQDLIELLKKGDEQAFRKLVETWQDLVFNTVLGMVQDFQEAEDLSQEVFIQVYQSIHQFRGDAKLSTWIYRIAVTKSLDWGRKRKTKKRIDLMKSLIGFGEKDAQPSEFIHPGVVMENKESAGKLWRAMQSLPDNQRVAFTLVKVEGLSYEEVASIMETTIKAVEALMHRAKENLRKQLKDYYTKQEIGYMKSEDLHKNIEQDLASLDGMKRAAAPDFFYTRLQARMENELTTPAWIPFGKPVWLIATLLVFLVLNTMMIKQTKLSKTNTSSEREGSSLQSFAAEYELSSTVNY